MASHGEEKAQWEVNFFTPCQLVGSVTFKNRIIPVMCSQEHCKADPNDLTYMQEDYMYIPIWTLGEFNRLQQIKILGPERDEVVEIAKYENDDWQISMGSLMTGHYTISRSVNAITKRADSYKIPKIPRVLGTFAGTEGKVRVTSGPMVLGAHHMVIPMPVDWQPLFGMQREVLRLLPELAMIVGQDYPNRQIGDVIRAYVLVAGHASYLYFLLTKNRDEEVGEMGPYIRALALIAKDVEQMGIQHLVMTRPTHQPYLLSWLELARFLSKSFKKRTLRIVLVTGFDSEEMTPWLPNARDADERAELIRLPWYWQ